MGEGRRPETVAAADEDPHPEITLRQISAWSLAILATVAVGFLLYAVLAIGVLVVIWTVSRSWIAPGGRAVSAVEPEHIEEIPA